jgi:hypothetical protein
MAKKHPVEVIKMVWEDLNDCANQSGNVLDWRSQELDPQTIGAVREWRHSVPQPENITTLECASCRCTSRILVTPYCQSGPQTITRCPVCGAAERSNLHFVKD